MEAEPRRSLLDKLMPTRSRQHNTGKCHVTRLTRRAAVILLASLLLTCNGCLLMALPRLMSSDDSENPTSYVPALSLPESPKTIQAKVRLTSFVDRIPALDSDLKGKNRRQAVTAPESMQGELAELVRRAILTDFRVNLVFSSVRVHEDQPDLLISGVVYQFAEYRSRPWYAKIPLVGKALGSKDHVEGGVNLDLIVSTPTGYLIGIYHGRAHFPDTDTAASGKENKSSSPGIDLNRAFSEAVHQIREQMLGDQELVSGRWRNGHS